VDSAVLFDFGGTLDADGIAWKERFHRLFAGEGVAVGPGQFDPVFYAADDALVGTVPASLSLEDTVLRVANGVAAALRAEDATLGARVAARFLADARVCFEANAPLLERLAERYRLGIVSNFYGNLPTVCAPSWWATHWPVIWRARERREWRISGSRPIRRARDGRAARKIA
jgi:FMN phosphatase YigB (HAD superfamily)